MVLKYEKNIQGSWAHIANASGESEIFDISAVRMLWRMIDGWESCRWAVIFSYSTKLLNINTYDKLYHRVWAILLCSYSSFRTDFICCFISTELPLLFKQKTKKARSVGFMPLLLHYIKPIVTADMKYSGNYLSHYFRLPL